MSHQNLKSVIPPYLALCESFLLWPTNSYKGVQIDFSQPTKIKLSNYRDNLLNFNQQLDHNFSHVNRFLFSVFICDCAIFYDINMKLVIMSNGTH